jgi:hypothetical protein
VAVAASLEFDLSRLLCIALLWCLPVIGMAEHHVVIVQGLDGGPAYGEQFTAQVANIEIASLSLTQDSNVHVLRGADANRDAILELFQWLSESAALQQVTVYLVGHGSYDNHDYKFNLPGPDLTGAEIATALDEFETDDIVFVNTSSASGALEELVHKQRRVTVLATRSGSERHATRFGGFFAEALSSETADVDKDKTVSLIEAFRYAERQVADYFDRNGQLATEHAVLHGERADRFALAKLSKRAPGTANGPLAGLQQQRDSLTAEIDTLRLKRDEMSAADYQGALMPKLLALARLEGAIEAETEGQNGD